MESRREAILAYAKSLACLPTLDTITQKLALLLAAPRVSLSRLLEIVQYDPSLSSRLIGVANSAWYNRGVPVVSLKRAMIALGLEEVKSILMCSVFYDGLLKKSGLSNEEVFELWKHSLLVAFAARTFSTPSPKDSEQAFIAGMFHDIGKVPLHLLYSHGANEEACAWEDVCSREQQLFGVDHQEIGFYMAAEWKLPEEYRGAIRLHHVQHAESPMAQLVRAANILVESEDGDKSLMQKKKAIQADVDRIINIFAN